MPDPRRSTGAPAHRDLRTVAGAAHPGMDTAGRVGARRCRRFARTGPAPGARRRVARLVATCPATATLHRHVAAARAAGGRLWTAAVAGTAARGLAADRLWPVSLPDGRTARAVPAAVVAQSARGTARSQPARLAACPGRC